MKVLYIPAKADISLKKVSEGLAKLSYKSYSIATTVQHLHKLGEAKQVLESHGKKVYIGKPKLHAICPGQVLGCDTTAFSDKADAYVFFGSGKFHPLAIETSKPVYIANPYTEEIHEISEQEKKLFRNRRAAQVAKVKDATKIGILVSTKSGQNRMAEAKKLKTKLEKGGKRVYIFVSDYITPNELLNFPDIEAWVNTACPRLVEDEFPKPIADWKAF